MNSGIVTFFQKGYEVWGSRLVSIENTAINNNHKAIHRLNAL